MTNYKYLFLDRDGVINVERPNDYVKTIKEFIFIEGAKEAMELLSQKFKKIFLITNQRGIGRSIMTDNDLREIHQYMLSELVNYNGRIDNIYYCSELNNSSINRKPNIGMAYQALEQYPDLDFGQSIMVGNSRSDIEFANKLNIYSVLVGDKYDKGDNIYQIIDKYYENLYTFARQVETKMK